LLPIAATLRIGSRVAAALAHAHRCGIVHRDVKPDNILIDWPGNTVKLADFGIASLGDSFRTQTGVVLGTPYYMSPEQLCGGVIDARTDLYALGVVLFETLCGQRPHAATSLGALLRQVASHDAPRLSHVRPAIPAAVSKLVGTLLSRQPGRRPTAADSVSSDLDSLATNCPEPDDGPKSRG
jgi:serine/threonine-protein kinase